MRAHRLRPSRLRFALVALLAALVVGCGGQEANRPAGGGTGGGGAPPGSSIDPRAFAADRFTVGSKEFTEQLVLGQIAIEALRAGGAVVQDATGIEGSEATRRALESGDIDMYWEYTGTAQLVHLDQQPSSDPQQQYRSVSQADEENGIAWLEPAQANNAYAIAARREVRRPLDVTTISDLEALVRRDPQQAGLCLAEEFAGRPDGLAKLEQTYGFDYPTNLVTEVPDESQVYDEIERGTTCTFGVVFLTDGRLVSNQFYVLEDDEDFAATYRPALNVRSEVLQRNPGLGPLFDDIAAELTSATLRELNARVEAGARPDEVARSFLDVNGFTG